MTSALQQLVEELVKEALRGFNFNKFKATPGIDAKIAYAESILPKMGMGSSRIVFAFSGGKALKIARNAKGLGQNEAEVDLFTDPQTKPVVARIFDADPNNEWVISEIVQPLEPTRQAWEAATGFDYLLFTGAVRDWEEKGKPDIDAYFQELVTVWQGRLSELIRKGQQQNQMYTVTQRRVKNYIRMSKSALAKGVMKLISQGLNTADVANIKADTSDNVIGHYGKTIDGRIVLLDYGYTDIVWQQHYNPKRPGATKDPEGIGSAAASDETPPDGSAVAFHSMSSSGKRFGV